ncbi:MAG: S1 family peptidase [Myxococcaceae bacterium]|jgi:hypothetical protein|nr:S1 family peptidase [Myxococcaceae bacterium]
MSRAALLCLVLAGCQASTPTPGARVDAIFGGAPAPGDDAVFFVDDDAGTCSATLIAPRTLLLAAHCVQDGVPMVAHNRPRSDGGDGGVYAIVKRQTWAQAIDAGAADLALLLLDRPPPVAPRPWTWWGPAPAIGSKVRHVGYGRSEVGPPGERRAVVTDVTGATEARAYGMVLLTGNLGQGLCFGDSGGPALAEADGGERVVAVHSFITTECGAGVSNSVLLYPYRRFIEHWLAANEPPQCARDGRCVEGCAPEDPDCRCGLDGVCRADCPPGDDLDCAGACSVDGVCSPRADCPADADCVPDGEFCLGPTQCAGRVCVNDAQNPSRYCSQACDAQRPCPETMTCDAARSVCQLRQLPLAAEGDSCASALVKCATGLACTDVGGDKRCYRTCTSQAQCLAGTRCQFQRVGTCVPAPVRLDAGTAWEGPVAPTGCSSAPLAAAFVAALLVGTRRRRRR